MKKIILLFLPILFLLVSCEQDDIFPKIENTTNGEKWTIKIGSSPSEVYSQVKELGNEKGFETVALVYRQAFLTPQEIKDIFRFYNAITLQTKSGVLERAVIEFNQDKVSSIEVGGALLDNISAWPSGSNNESTIQIDDQIDIMYEKLEAIWQIQPYNNYQIILPDKSLDKPFDPDMTNYEEWAFNFSKNISSNKVERSFVRLFFQNEELVKIRHEYSENEMVN